VTNLRFSYKNAPTIITCIITRKIKRIIYNIICNNFRFHNFARLLPGKPSSPRSPSSPSGPDGPGNPGRPSPPVGPVGPLDPGIPDRPSGPGSPRSPFRPTSPRTQTPGIGPRCEQYLAHHSALSIFTSDL